MSEKLNERTTLELLDAFGAFRNNGRPLKASEKAKRGAILKELTARINDLNGLAECLDMVRETLAVFLGEGHMKGTPPMFYPEAIRTAMFRAQRGDYLPKPHTPDLPASPPETPNG